MRMGTRSGGDAATAFSALHLLRNYHQLFAAPTGSGFASVCTPYEVHHVQREPRGGGLGEWPDVAGAFQPYLPSAIAAPVPLSDAKGRLLLTAARRPRGEKKPIPDDQKDDRYYERRKRNNQAAKKSRDARKLREDQIALRAALLEHENAVLRTQVLTLREEIHSLRQLLFARGKSRDDDDDDVQSRVRVSDRSGSSADERSD